MRKPDGPERASLRARIIQPVVAKQGSLFLLTSEEGDVHAGSDQGLYFHDMRYLSVATLRLNGGVLVSLLADASEGHRAVFELTNPDLEDDSGEVRVRKEALGIRREKCLGDDYTEVLTVRNYLTAATEFTLTVVFDADFADMFVVRGMHPGKRGKLHGPTWRGETLTFRYDGADGHARTAALHFSHPPDARDHGELTYRLCLKHQQQWQLKITCELRDGRTSQLESRPDQTGGPRDTDREHAHSGSLAGDTQIETSNPLFNEIITRCFLDLHMLSMRQQDHVFFAAGVPWYVALFGRDSLVTSIQMAAFEPDVGANTLRVLACHQGTRVDDWRDEQPGKILHELRVDELANLNEIPQTPFLAASTPRPSFSFCSDSTQPGRAASISSKNSATTSIVRWPGSTSSVTLTTTGSSITRRTHRAVGATRAGRTLQMAS
jgi:glycogen debranching enzyme